MMIEARQRSPNTSLAPPPISYTFFLDPSLSPVTSYPIHYLITS